MALPLISLYSGCGGMDYGFEAAGFATRVALEMDATCCRTLRDSRRWPVMETDIFAVTPGEILTQARLAPREAAILIGGPPCQPFSKSGYWARGDSARLDDPRANTLTAYLDVVAYAQPAAFVLENVSGLAFAGKDEGLNHLLDRIRRLNRATGLNYRPTWKILKAVEHGVPQLRERLFLVAARDGAPFDFPTPTHAEPIPAGDALPLATIAPYRTCWDAIGDLENVPHEDDLTMRGKWARLLPSVPEGQNYLWHTDRGGGEPLFGWRRRYWNFLLKLAKDRPSWTIQAQPGPSTGPFHWQNRRLSRRELARLQTFPDDVRIAGSYADAHRQIGNAVPSLLAEVVGREIRRQWLRDLRGPRLNVNPELLPPLRPGCPPPTQTTRVPPAYLPLRHTETAHPGTGKGHRAAQRLVSAA